MNESLVRLLLHECWEDAPRTRHKSLVTSFLIRETFGGEIRTCRDDGTFCNRILDADYCFSATTPSAGTHELLEWPELIERIPTVAAELIPMRAKWRRTLSRRLPLPSISHVVIQDEEANPGSYACPDFSCVLLTADSAERLDTDFFFPGQTFWLKRTAGPIVATATLDRWIVGSRCDWTSGDLLHAAAGYPIARHRAFWKTLDDHPGRAFLLLHLKDASVLDVPIYPAAEAHGRRVIALSDYARLITWLHSDDCVLNLPAPVVEEQPIALRYQFRWEPLLSPEVSMRLTERTRRGGRFRDRVEALNGALLEYFTFLDAVAETDTLDLFTEDQLCLLAELNEECKAEPDRIARLAATLLDLGRAGVYSASAGIDSAEMISLSETLRQLTPEQTLLLLDALRRRAATCPAPVRDAWLESLESNMDEE